MLLSVLAVVVGVVLLVWSSDRFVYGASVTARNLGVSPLVVGLTVVGIGTSAPEIFVSTVAAWEGKLGLSIGNAVGSNIANVGLIVGVSAIVSPLAVHSQTLKREFPLMFAVMLLAGLLLLDQELDRGDGTILAVAFVFIVTVMAVIGMRARGSDPLGDEFAQKIPSSVSTAVALGWTLVGLLLLLLS